MEKLRKKASNLSTCVSYSTMEVEDNQIGKDPLFNGNFDIWKERMKNFSMA